MKRSIECRVKFTITTNIETFKKLCLAKIIQCLFKTNPCFKRARNSTTKVPSSEYRVKIWIKWWIITIISIIYRSIHISMETFWITRVMRVSVLWIIHTFKFTKLTEHIIHFSKQTLISLIAIKRIRITQVALQTLEVFGLNTTEWFIMKVLNRNLELRIQTLSQKIF